jgi:hypothetical protein
MNILIEFILGMCVGIEAPGDGIYLVLHLGPVRVVLVSDDYMKEADESV